MNDALKKKIIEYYTSYYRDECSLPDWETRVHARLDEEAIEKKRMQALTSNFGFSMGGKRHLIVGAGTGGLAVCLKTEYGADVYGVEPSAQECEIIKMKCEEYGIDSEHFHQAYGEALPFDPESFDFVHCFTVLEHVTDVETCIDEMLRVIKPDGRIIINTPNYAYPYEGHYKIYFPTFLPKVFGYLYLMLLGKNHRFYSTIQFITERNINRILVRKQDIQWYRIYSSQKKNMGNAGWLVNHLLFKRFIYPQQNIILFKKNN